LDFADVPSNRTTGGDNLQCQVGLLPIAAGAALMSPMGQVSLSGGTLVGADQISTGSRGTATPITLFEHPLEIARRLPLMIGREGQGTRAHHARTCVE